MSSFAICRERVRRRRRRKRQRQEHARPLLIGLERRRRAASVGGRDAIDRSDSARMAAPRRRRRWSSRIRNRRSTRAGASPSIVTQALEAAGHAALQRASNGARRLLLAEIGLPAELCDALSRRSFPAASASASTSRARSARRRAAGRRRDRVRPRRLGAGAAHRAFAPPAASPAWLSQQQRGHQQRPRKTPGGMSTATGAEHTQGCGEIAKV